MLLWRRIRRLQRRLVSVHCNTLISPSPQVDKRAAILLDKIMYAVQKALDEDKNGKIAAGHPNLASFASVSRYLQITFFRK